MSSGYDPPFNVSPLIRLGRWTALILGIFYGISKHQYYSGVAAKEYEIAEEKKRIRAAQLAEQKIIQAANEKRAFELLSQKPGGGGESGDHH